MLKIFFDLRFWSKCVKEMQPVQLCICYSLNFSATVGEIEQHLLCHAPYACAIVLLAIWLAKLTLIQRNPFLSNRFLSFYTNYFYLFIWKVSYSRFFPVLCSANTKKPTNTTAVNAFPFTFLKYFWPIKYVLRLQNDVVIICRLL